MSSSEQGPSELSRQQAREQPAPRRRLGRWLPLAMVATVVVVLSAILLAHAAASTPNLLGGSDAAPQTWRTYHDTLGLFTLRLPPGWTARTEPATTWYGNSTASVPVSIDMVTFNDPAQGTGSAYVWITAYPIKTAAARQYYCVQPSNLQRFAPRSLSSMEPSGVWLFTTETGNFQVDVAIPGVVAPVGTSLLHPAPTATPLPAAWVATDKSEVNAMLVSFQPTDPKPLTCR